MEGETWGDLRFIGESVEFSFECVDLSVPRGIHMEQVVAMFATRACVVGETWLLKFADQPVLTSISSFRSFREKGMCPISSLL